MRYFIYVLVTLAVVLSASLIPTATDADVKYADLPRIDTVTVQNVKLICVENRCYDLNKVPARYRNVSDQQPQRL